MADLSPTGSCYDLANQTDALSKHSISKANFMTYVSNFFDQPFGSIPLASFDAANILAGITATGVDCSYYIMVYATDNTDNSNIVVSVGHDSRIPPDMPGGNNTNAPLYTRFYDLTLFLGLFATPPIQPFMEAAPALFEFSHAETPDGDNPGGFVDGYVFQVTDTLGNITYWDLSGGIPPQQ